MNTKQDIKSVLKSNQVEKWGVSINGVSFEILERTEKAVKLNNIEAGMDKTYPVWVPITAIGFEMKKLSVGETYFFHFKKWFYEKLQFEKPWKRVSLGITCY